MLHNATRHDWASVEPAIFGTLFERSLDPCEALAARRALHQQGRDSAYRRASGDGATPRAVGRGTRGGRGASSTAR